MSTKLCFAMLALLSWMLSFVVILTSALFANCYFINEDYPTNILILGLVNIFSVVYFITINFREKIK